jgi:sugar (pentulose or hexulose) kinase
MPDLLGIDCSTTAAKAVAWDRGGKARVEGRASFEEVRTQPGYSEQRASRIGPSPRSEAQEHDPRAAGRPRALLIA